MPAFKHLNSRSFFISQTFICNIKLKCAKNKAKAKQHTEAELLLFEKFSHSSPRNQPRIIGDILKNV